VYVADGPVWVHSARQYRHPRPSSAGASIVFGGRPSTTSTSMRRPVSGPRRRTAVIVGPVSASEIPIFALSIICRGGAFTALRPLQRRMRTGGDHTSDLVMRHVLEQASPPVTWDLTRPPPGTGITAAHADWAFCVGEDLLSRSAAYLNGIDGCRAEHGNRASRWRSLLRPSQRHGARPQRRRCGPGADADLVDTRSGPRAGDSCESGRPRSHAAADDSCRAG